MLPKKHGAILLTGASASVKGYPQSAPFAMGKFALRGLAQSMARELSPQGIHVAHFVIDGGIRSARRPEPATQPDSMLDPDAIAANYCFSSASRAARGRGRSSCGRGWRSSDAAQSRIRAQRADHDGQGHHSRAVADAGRRIGHAPPGSASALCFLGLLTIFLF